ncbi:MAG: hypothetical protein EAZ92_17470 [Candidatus Kapaibacterium sp.]|nr:MAG: hypothetical protein EAZ92_17470 [Candidatus Kapabacteria bacterium]
MLFTFLLQMPLYTMHLRRSIIFSLFGCVLFLLSAAESIAQASGTAQQTQASALAREGFAKQQRGDAQGALANFTKALEMWKSPEIYVMRAQLYGTALRNPQAAIADASEAIKLAPEKGSGYFLRGVNYLNTQQVQAAEQDLKKCIALKLHIAPVYKVLAIVLSVQQRFSEAVDIATKGLKLFPNEGELYYERGNYFVNLKRCKDAISDYNQAIKFLPNMQEAYLNRANCNAELGDLQSAVKDYTALMALDSNNIKYIGNRGNTYSALGQYEKAISDLQKAVALDSSLFRTRAFLIRTYYNAGKISLCEKECTVILERNPQDISGFANAGGVASAFLQRENFINGDVFALRSLSRAALKNMRGAIADRKKADYLQAESGSPTDIPKVLERTFIPAENFPETLQFFPRNERDSALVELRGRLLVQNADSAYVRLFKNGKEILRKAMAVKYEQIGKQTAASISLAVPLHAEASLYSFAFGAIARENGIPREVAILQRDSLVCGDVVFVSGQSNAVLGESSNALNPYLRTFAVGSADSFWGIACAKTNDTYNIGGMALRLAEELFAASNIPQAVINGGLSGSTIEQHFRDNANPVQIRSWYGRMLWRARTSGLASAARAMVWYQGESNANAGYEQKFATLLNSWKQDYTGLRKVIVVQVRPSECFQSPENTPREAQRLLAMSARASKETPSVEVLSAAAVPDHDGCHYGNGGYAVLGTRLAKILMRDLYAGKDTLGISSPLLLAATWNNAEKTEIRLIFASNDTLVCGNDTTIAGKIRSLRSDAFFLDGAPALCSRVRAEKNAIILSLAAPSAARTITYIPEKCYADASANAQTTVPSNAPCKNVYEGPWITTSRGGVGALTFANVAIQ